MPITSSTSNSSPKKHFLSLVRPTPVKVVKPKTYSLTKEETQLLESFRATAQYARFVTLNVSKRAAEASPAPATTSSCSSLLASALPDNTPTLSSTEAHMLQVFRSGADNAQEIVLGFAERFIARYPRRTTSLLHLV